MTSPASSPLTTDAEIARAALARWRADPCAFFRDVLAFDPWPRQADIARAVRAHKFVACRSGHKVGKSSIAAAIAAWFAVCHADAQVVLTAPSHHQIQNIIWKELGNMYRRAQRRGTPLGGELFETPEVGWRLGEGRNVFGLSTDKPERFAGLSSPNLLFVVDEASGVDEAIFEAIFGNTAGGAHVLLISNPTRTSGTFFDAFHSKRDNWHKLSVSSLESPNMGADPAQFVPGLATPEWVAWCKRQWGENSPYYRVRVLGEFPDTGDNSVIGLADVDAAIARGRELHPGAEPLVLGLDPARFGDDETVIAARRGCYVYPLHALHSLDTIEVAGAAIAYAQQLARFDEVPTVKVDTIGIGAGVYDTLARDSRVAVLGVNVSESSDDPDHYPNLRSQLWFGTRDWLREGGALPDDERLAAELVAPVYSFDARGRQVVESKDRVRERLKRSPDRADALNLCVYGLGDAPGFAGLGSGVALGGRRL